MKKRYFISVLTLIGVGSIVYTFKDPDIRLFLMRSLQRGSRVGSLIPSSHRLGQALALPMKQGPDYPNRKILEAGSGIGGNVTGAIIANLRPTDHLDLVEIEPLYCRILEKKYGHLSNVSIHCISLTEFAPGYAYDYIISTLPHSIFPLALLEEIFTSYDRLMNDQALLTHIHYICNNLENPIEQWLHEYVLGNTINKEEIPSIKAAMENFYHDRQATFTRVWRNIPPTDVYYIPKLQEN